MANSADNLIWIYTVLQRQDISGFSRTRVNKSITKTCLYNFDPLKPHFYIVKLGFTGVYIDFLISAQNIDCGYSLEPPRRGGSNEYPQSMGEAVLTSTHKSMFQSIDCGYSLEPPRRGGSNEYSQSMSEAVLTSTHNLCFEQNYEKYSFFIWIFSVFGGEIFYISE